MTSDVMHRFNHTQARLVPKRRGAFSLSGLRIDGSEQEKREEKKLKYRMSEEERRKKRECKQ